MKKRTNDSVACFLKAAVNKNSKHLTYIYTSSGTIRRPGFLFSYCPNHAALSNCRTFDNHSFHCLDNVFQLFTWISMHTHCIRPLHISKLMAKTKMSSYN